MNQPAELSGPVEAAGDRIAGSPAWRALGIEPIAAGEGRATIRMRVAESMANFQGVCHGGFIAALADSVMGRALRTVIADGARSATIDLKLSFISPALIGSWLVASGEVIHHGRATAVLECRVRDELSGDLVATASGTFKLAPAKHVD